MTDTPQYKIIDKFDRMLGSLKDRPDVTETKPSTVVDHSPFIGAAQTFIIQTKRDREKGDYIFLQYVDDVTSVRIFLPPAAADAIARQREALTTKVRKRVGRESAQARKARGELPAFMKGKKNRGKKKAKAAHEEVERNS